MKLLETAGLELHVRAGDGFPQWEVVKDGEMLFSTADGLVAERVWMDLLEYGLEKDCAECGRVAVGDCLMHNGYVVTTAWMYPHLVQLEELFNKDGDPVHSMVAKEAGFVLCEHFLRGPDGKGWSHPCKWAVVGMEGDRFETSNRLVAGMVYKEWVKNEGDGMACDTCGMVDGANGCKNDGHTGFRISEVWKDICGPAALSELRDDQTAYLTKLKKEEETEKAFSRAFPTREETKEAIKSRVTDMVDKIVEEELTRLFGREPGS